MIDHVVNHMIDHVIDHTEVANRRCSENVLSKLTLNRKGLKTS